MRTAGALFKLGDLDRLDEALALAERWRGSDDDALACQVAGAIRDKRGEPAQAIPLLQRALSEHRARSDHEEAARDVWYLAGALLHEGRLGEALDDAEAGVQEADLASSSATQPRLRGRAQQILGKVLMEIGDFEAAHQMLREAQQALARWPRDRAWTLLQLGMLLQAGDDHALAATFFEKALELASTADVPPVVTAARLNLARESRELGDLDAAELQMNHLDKTTRGLPTARLVDGLIAADRGHRELAERLLAEAAADASTDDYAMDIAVQRGQLAEHASDLTAAERYYGAGVELAETMRRNTQSLELRPWILARRRVPFALLLSLLARQDRRVEALVVAEQLHARTWHDALVRSTGASEARARVSSASSLDRRLQAGATDALRPDELLALLRGREALVFSDTGSDLWRFHAIDGVIVQVDRLPDRARALIETRRRTPDDRTIAAELGALLIPPAARVPSQRTLYVVTNGLLDTISFAALRPGGRFLVEDRVISRLPGIVALRCRARHRTPTPSVFLGDSRDDLPAARDEASVLAGRAGGIAFVGPAATVERLVASRDAELLHLAIHAVVDQTGGRLLLANQALVTAAEIVAREIGPRVAVLAGCATGVSPDAEGWGALSSAFLAAGSRSVVATLRWVADSDARDMMGRFYALGGDRQPALALALAQRQLISAGSPTWAPFVVYGSAEADDCEVSP